MGMWNKTHEDVIFGYEADLWDRYPRHVVQAFFAVSYTDIIAVSQGDVYHEDEEISNALEAFAQRWGGLSDNIFLRVLTQAQDRDRRAAIFAIGQSDFPQAVDVLVPFLKSSQTLERYAAALVLGLRRDARALPIVEEYILADEPCLDDGHPHQDKAARRLLPEAQIWFGRYRPVMIRVLASFGPASVVPVLRKAFLKYWQVEQHTISSNYRLPDGLLYALGKRGDFSVLQEISLPDFHRRLAMISLVLGAWNADERYIHRPGNDLHHEVLLNRELQQEVVSGCITRLGVSEQEARQCVTA